MPLVKRGNFCYIYFTTKSIFQWAKDLNLRTIKLLEHVGVNACDLRLDAGFLHVTLKV